MSRILVAEDPLETLMWLKEFLEERGHDVVLAVSGSQALEMAHQTAMDLILVGAGLRNPDAYALCRQIKGDLALAAVPVVFLGCLDGAEAFCAGASDQLAEVCPGPELAARLEQRLEQGRLVASLAEARAELDACRRAKMTFASSLVHDIRSPMTTVSLALDLYETAGAIPEDVVGYCRRGLHGLNAMLLDMMVFACGEAESISERVPMEAAPLLQNLQKNLSARAQQARNVLELSLGSRLPRLLGDPEKLERIFWEMMDLALVRTPVGGRVRGRAERREAEAGEPDHPWLRLEVWVGGQGLSPEELTQAFDPFCHVAGIKNSMGNRFGLAVAKRLAHAHGGRLFAEERFGMGVVLVVELPCE